MAKIMVTGATGLLGRALVKQLQQVNAHQVIACGYSRVGEGEFQLDLTQNQQVTDFIALHQPQVIVHCAAERRPDISEQDPQAALALNADATRTLAQAARDNGAWLLYISTDYVFDGTQPKYTEKAATNPVNFYGESKLLGEKIIAEVAAQFAVLRLPILYGEVQTLEESAVTVLLRSLQDGFKPSVAKPATLPVDDWAVRSPTSTEDIALAIEKLLNLQLAGESITGHYHFSAAQTMTKYQMLLQMAKVLNVSTEHLQPVTSPTDSAKRPKDCTLSCERLMSLGIKSTLPFASGITKALQQSVVVQQWLKQVDERQS